MKINIELWQHQKVMAEFMLNRPYALVAADMGTGKTLAALQMIAESGYQKILVITTKKGIKVWENEFNQFVENAEIIPLWDGTTQSKTQKVQAAFYSKNRYVGTQIVVANYESSWRSPLINEFYRLKFDMIILDESHRIKASNTQVSKQLYRLGKTIPYRYALTGTPLPNSPLDIFGQARFLDDNLYTIDGKQLLKSFTKFRDHYALTYPLGPGVAAIRGYKNLDELGKIMERFTYRVKAEDVLDLPDKVHITRTVELSPSIMRTYNKFAKEAYAELAAGVMTADNVLVKTLRLQQFTGGYYAPDKGQLTKVHEEKLSELDDIILGIGDEPVVIFARFTAEIEAIQSLLQLYGDTGILSGSFNDLEDWQNGKLRYLVVQINTGAEAISLVRARYFIYYSTVHSLGTYDQSLARGARPGQLADHVFYYHLVAKNTIDEAIYKALNDKTNVNSEIISYIKSFKKEI